MNAPPVVEALGLLQEAKSELDDDQNELAQSTTPSPFITCTAPKMLAIYTWPYRRTKPSAGSSRLPVSRRLARRARMTKHIVVC